MNIQSNQNNVATSEVFCTSCGSMIGVGSDKASIQCAACHYAELREAIRYG